MERFARSRTGGPCVLSPLCILACPPPFLAAPHTSARPLPFGGSRSKEEEATPGHSGVLSRTQGSPSSRAAVLPFPEICL